MEKQGEYETPDEFCLDTPARLKAFSHPTRLAILEQLAASSLQTNEELAAALAIASGKLYFHTKRLLDAGLIEPAGTRQKGPITEKLYRATAARYVLPPLVKGGDAPPLARTIAAALSLYESTWAETGGLPGSLEWGFALVLPHSPERRREFVQRLRAVFDDFREGSDDPDAALLALSVLLHDVPMPPKGGKSDP